MKKVMRWVRHSALRCGTARRASRRLCVAGIVVLWIGGCASTNPQPASSVSHAIEQSRHVGPDAPSSPARGVRSIPTDERGAPIAVIDGQPLPRSALIDPLLRQHGAELLELRIVLRAAQRRARDQGIMVTESDVREEFDRALDSLVDPLAALTDGSVERTAANALLDEVLVRRRMSREMFMMGMKRNAYLRRIIEADLDVTEPQIRKEYARRFGPRVRIRHIQFASLRGVERVMEQLRRGEDFADLARRSSANTASGDDGGLLAPFSATDEEVPEALRKAAFKLKKGETSGAIRVGAWFHVVRVVTRLPAEDPGFEKERAVLRRVVADRMVARRMEGLYDELLDGARVRINDPVLRKAYLEARRSPAP